MVEEQKACAASQPTAYSPPPPASAQKLSFWEKLEAIYIGWNAPPWLVLWANERERKRK